MRPFRVCDACSIRRVKCDGQAPCSRCVSSSLECQRLRTRKKMGPKNVHRKTLSRLASAGVHQSPEPLAHPFDDGYQDQVPLPETSRGEPNHMAPFAVLELYLEIYRRKMYQVWPVVNTTELVERLRGSPFDSEAYMLAVSVCTATILQLQLAVVDSEMPAPQSCIDEVEHMRSTSRYRRRPTSSSLLTSFFLHISYLHFEQQTTSTLLLREAITMLHLLGLHQPSHYEDLDHATIQSHLRILWLLFITERAHARQYDVPCTLSILPGLPHLQQDDNSPDSSAFTCLCNMFAAFDNVGPNGTDDIIAADQQLSTIPPWSRSYNSVQQADLAVTRQWMRLLLWKTAVPRLAMTAEASGTLNSIVFPVQVARDLLSSITLLSMDALEAHGPGMELKLFTMATSLADVMTCVPTHSAVVSEFGALDCLMQISERLQSFRGGTEAVMSVLRERFVEIGLDRVPIRRIAGLSPASDESEFSETSPDAAASVVELEENAT